jgi:hypothetical protein
MYALQGKTRPTRHTLSMLSPCMPLDHTYLTWSTYNNLLWVIDRFERIPLLPSKRNTRQHPYHGGWLIYGSPSSFSPPLSQWSSRLNPRLCWWQAARLTGPIYQQTIGTFNMLVGANPSVINRHMQGLQPWRCQLCTYHSPTFSSSGLHFTSKGPARSRVILYSTN